MSRASQLIGGVYSCLEIVLVIMSNNLARTTFVVTPVTFTFLKFHLSLSLSL